MKRLKEITELLVAGVIDQATADKINTYYETKAGSPQNKLVIVFGILGSLLVGLGIILILAHNWDELPRLIKTIIAFAPLIVGQGICGYVLLKKTNNTTWTESSSTFLFLAIGICLSLISQIYNIPGKLSTFVLTWMLLALPIVYIMKSPMASLLYITGITYYACEVGYWSHPNVESYVYWGLILAILPYYYYLHRYRRESNFYTFHNWFIPLSLVIVLGTLATDAGHLMFVAYISLFGLLYQIGHTPALADEKIRNNGYLVLGSLGTVTLLLVLSFDWFWKDLRKEEFSTAQWLITPEGITAILLTLAALILLVLQKRRQSPLVFKPVDLAFLLFVGIFLLGTFSPWVTILINLLVLAIGVLTIREGARRNHYGILNYGLLIFMALVICRFFDIQIHFIFRGLLFVIVGAGFFFANYRMANKKIKPNAIQE